MKSLRLVGLLVLASHLAVAQKQPATDKTAPTFMLPSQDGSRISLEQNRGKWVVLYFYPKDFTSGCTLEAHNFQRDLGRYQAANAVILGVSLDSVDSHKEFCAKEGLNFRLLSDADHLVTKSYGSLMTVKDHDYAARNTFLIDPSGVIRKVYLKVNPATHSEDVLADLTQLQAAK